VEQVYVALGSNLGDRAAHLAFARAALAALPRTRLVATSRVEETAPLPVPPGVAEAARVSPRQQPPYLNQMALLETALEPPELLARLLAIETARGRAREPGTRWEPRTLDLDVVRFGEREVRTTGLTLPHPGLADRAFWQRGIAELAALPAARHHG
jgi:2-amino-4-hydroxy-6-hydroxymethyldihydropteridine diphosphokinase